MQTDLNDPTRNMFGLKPCPECGGKHCYPTRPTPKNPGGNVLCDDCGCNEPLEELAPRNNHMED